MVQLLVMLYLAYLCMCLAPGPSLRQWGAVTWWRLMVMGPRL